MTVSSLLQYERWNFPLLSLRPENNVSIGFGINLLPNAGR